MTKGPIPNNLPVNPVFYDFEASALNGPPIEVGWASFDSDTGLIKSESFLIKPADDWDPETSWDHEAEELHGIKLADVVQTGLAPFAVANRMNEVLLARDLYSDSPFDEHWLQQLFDAAGVEVKFRVQMLLADILIERLARNRNIASNDYADICNKVRRASPPNHRAEVDARYWASLWSAVLNVGRT